MDAGSWLTIGLHPTSAPIRIEATAAVALEVCPAGLDGELAGNSSWPSSFDFPSCMPLTPSGGATLPATDGLTHVAFAVRPIPPAGVVPLAVLVSYSAIDAFVEVIPPIGTAGTDLTVTYTPRSATTGAVASFVGQARAAAGYSVAIAQAGRAIAHPSACDFGSEIQCIGEVTPSEPVDVHLTGPGSPTVVLSLAWN